MPRKKRNRSKSKQLRCDAAFGPAPIFRGEDEEAYGELFESVFSYVEPTNFLEEIWARDIVDLTWDILRLRRFKQALVEPNMDDAIFTTLQPIVGPTLVGWLLDVKKRWAVQDPEAIAEVEAVLEKVNLSMATIVGRAFAKNLGAHERIDRLVASAEERRNNTINQVDIRRVMVRKMEEAIKSVEVEQDGTVEAPTAIAAPEQVDAHEQ